MKKNSVLITILASLFLLLPAASGAQIIFERWYGGYACDSGESVAQTDDGGYIITGATCSFGVGSPGQYFNVYLIKTDAYGDTLWTKTFGGTDDDYGYSVAQTDDGGYIIVGYTGSLFGVRDVYLIKTDANGDMLWTKTFGGTSRDDGRSVAQTDDGGYIIAGETYSFGAGGSDVWLIKTDANGDALWTKTFGGTSVDYGISIAQTDDGGYIIAGGTGSFGAGSIDVYLIKTDANGDAIWTNTFGGTSVDYGHSVAQTDDGGYIITGHTESFGAGGNDVYLIKTDANGDSLWTKTFGGTDDDYGHSVAQTDDEGYIIAGYTWSFGPGWSAVYLIKTNANGDTLWTKTFGGSYGDYGYSVAQTDDEGYIIAGKTNSFGAGGEDVYLIKMGPDAQDSKRLTEGWNWESFPVLPNPAGTNALDVLEPILNPEVLHKVVYENRPVIYWNIDHWVNELEDENFRSIDGYKIKMYRDAELEIAGVREDPGTVIHLYAEVDKAPWPPPLGDGNWIGYFIPGSQLWQFAFSHIFDKITFIKADDWSYISGYSMPPSLCTVDYGKLYIVGVSEDCSFTWGLGLQQNPYTKSETSIFYYQEQADYMPIFVDSTEDISNIDEIGVFLEDECIGASVLEGFPVFIPAYIEDEDSTENKDFNELTFQVATYGKGGKRSIPAFVYNETQNNFVEEPVILDAKSYAIVRLGTGEGIEFPKEFTLFQNYPNPFNPRFNLGSTTISFIPSQGAEKSEIKIYNIKGQLVKTFLPLTTHNSPLTNVVWDGKDKTGKFMANGIYFYKLISGDKSAMKKMVIMR